MLQIMTYDTPYNKKALQKNIDTTVSLYVLAEVNVAVYTIILSRSTLVNVITQEMILKCI